MCRESMMKRTASAICLARTVCCSNLVFTADWEMHSWNRQKLEGGGGHLGPTVPATHPMRAQEDHQKPGSEDLPQISSQNSETQTSSLESLLQERPLGELHCISQETIDSRRERGNPGVTTKATQDTGWTARCAPTGSSHHPNPRATATY